MPPDVEAGESDVAQWMQSLPPIEPPPWQEGRVRGPWQPRRRSFAGLGAVAAAMLLGFGLTAFSRVAAVAADAGCSGALCAEPIVAVVDDPQVPLYQSLEALAAFDGEAGCWEALADLGGPR